MQLNVALVYMNDRNASKKNLDLFSIFLIWDEDKWT